MYSNEFNVDDDDGEDGLDVIWMGLFYNMTLDPSTSTRGTIPFGCVKWKWDKAFITSYTDFMKWPEVCQHQRLKFPHLCKVIRIEMKLCVWKGIINFKVTDMCQGMLLLLNYSRTCSMMWFCGASERILCSTMFWPATSQFGSWDSLKLEVILELEGTCNDLTTSSSRCGCVARRTVECPNSPR